MTVHAIKETEKYKFTNDWFGTTACVEDWEKIFTRIKPKRCLEIGSYEGRSAVFMLERLPPDGSLTCIDTWVGGADLSPEQMKGVEDRFNSNTKIALGSKVHPVSFHKRKQPSGLALAELIATGKRFDLIYIDGSHIAPDVLTDAVMAFRLLEDGGIMIFDDYIWTTPDRGDVLNAPGIAIDAFATIFSRSMATVALGGQRIFQRIA